MLLRPFFFVVALLVLAQAGLAQDEDREGGIIGTGIVGTITHLGSIHVNGQRILIDDSLAVEGAAAPITAGDLRPGHVVAVTVRPEADNWRALEIRQVLSLVGPVEAMDGTSLTVLGTHVDLGRLTPDFKTGDWVAVSGLWRSQTVLASRLDPVPETYRQARISGTYFGPDGQGRDVIGGTVIAGVKTRHLRPGNLVRATGRPVSGGIDVSRLETHLFDDAVTVVQIEGYFSKPQPSGLYTVHGSGLVAYTGQPEMIDVENKVVLCGESGRLGGIGAAGSEPARIALGRLGCHP